ncbi:MAG TPA: DUF5943 domain-containing protein [Alphaproteobacteria bacterium]|nr:DUF5943 domain-containing protein [Alphaproteobacteria bacterium]
MAKPQVPIEVDEDTGIWSVDGMPMILVPRHFFVNLHDAVEAGLGAEATRRLWWESGRLSAYQWCRKEAATHGLHGFDVFRHYMKRLSQRGWAQFTILDHDGATGHTRIGVRHSVFVLHHHGEGERRKLCYPFRGWFVGALDHVGEALGRPFGPLASEEIHCAAEGEHDACLFEVRPA